MSFFREASEKLGFTSQGNQVSRRQGTSAADLRQSYLHKAVTAAVPTPAPPNPALVAIPGAESTLGCGDETRALTLSAADHFHGAHTNNESYFDRPARKNIPGGSFDRVLRLKTVCWLAVGGTMEKVPAGKYEAILRVRSSNRSPDFKGDWRIGVGVRHSRDWNRSDVDNTGPLHLRNDNNYGAGGRLLEALPNDRFVSLSFGVLELDAPADVRFEMGGGNSFWCGGLEFDSLELRPVGPPWEVVRVLLLGMQQTGAEEPCLLAKLPTELLAQIVSRL